MRGERIERVGARGVLELCHALRGRTRHRLLRIDKKPRQGGGRFRAIEFAERQRHLLAHAGVGIRHHLIEQLHRRRISRVAKLDDRDAPLRRIGGLEPLADIAEVIIGFEHIRHGPPQQVGNVDLDRAGRAVGLARHAIPAFVVGHVGLVGHLADPQHVERTDIDADGAALVGDAFRLVDHDRDAGLAGG